MAGAESQLRRTRSGATAARMSLRTLLHLSQTPVSGFIAIGIGWGAFAASIPDIAAGLAMTKAEIGRALLFSASAGMIAMLAAPLVMARFGTNKRLIVPLLLAMALAFALAGQANGFWSLGAALFLIGCTTGTVDVTVNARISAIEAEADRPLMSFNHGCFSLAYAISAVCTGIAREFGAVPAQIFPVAGLAIVAVCLLPLTDRRRLATPIDLSTPRPPRQPLPWIIFGIGGLITIAFFAENATEVWSALHIEQTLGGRAAEGALGPALLGFTMALGRFSGQALSAAFGLVRLMTAAAFLAAAGGIMAALAPAPWVAYLGFGALGLGVASLAPLAFSLGGRYLTDDQRDIGIARMTVIGYAGFFFGPPMLGLLADAMGLRAAFLVVGLVLLAFPVSLQFLPRRAESRA